MRQRPRVLDDLGMRQLGSLVDMGSTTSPMIPTRPRRRGQAVMIARPCRETFRENSDNFQDNARGPCFCRYCTSLEILPHGILLPSRVPIFLVRLGLWFALIAWARCRDDRIKATHS